MPGLLERVVQTIQRHRMLAPGEHAGVAVSGGADSVCLLHLLASLAAPWNLRLTVLHLDHGLRGEESREDAEFVRALSVSLGLPIEIRRASLGEAGGNREQAARAARLKFFREAMAAHGIARVAVGHTRSDQAETVLFRFLRGAGTAGGRKQPKGARQRAVRSTFRRAATSSTRSRSQAFLRQSAFNAFGIVSNYG